MTILLALLSVFGLLISTYFTALAYRWVRPNTHWVPAFCRMDEQTCASIVFTPQARVFGLSNSVLGQVFYIAILLGILFGWVHGPESLLAAYLGASIMTIGLGVYLTYSLLFITHVRCALCFTSHGINLAIFGILVLGL